MNTAQETGRDQEIGIGFDTVADLFDGLGPSERADRSQMIRLNTAMAFWNSWIGASYGKWERCEGISKSDWPVLARQVAADLRAGQDISDPMVLRHFDTSQYFEQR